MALKAILDNLDELDAGFHDHYRKDDKLGKFVLDVEDFDAMPRVRGLKDEAAKNRIAARNFEQALAPYKALGELDVLTQTLDRIPELESAASGKGVDENKLNELVEGRLKGKLAPVERELGTLKQQNQQLTEQLTTYQKKEQLRNIGDSVRAAASKLKVLDTALEDAMLLAERVFEVQEDGTVVTKDGVGVTPGLPAEDWLKDMQSKRPHWWGPSVGGGAGGNKGGGSGMTNPWSADNWNMTEQGRLYKENPTRATQLAQAAGTSIGGPRPAKK